MESAENLNPETHPNTNESWIWSEPWPTSCSWQPGSHVAMVCVVCVKNRNWVLDCGGTDAGCPLNLQVGPSLPCEKLFFLKKTLHCWVPPVLLFASWTCMLPETAPSAGQEGKDGVIFGCDAACDHFTSWAKLLLSKTMLALVLFFFPKKWMNEWIFFYFLGSLAFCFSAPEGVFESGQGCNRNAALTGSSPPWIGAGWKGTEQKLAAAITSRMLQLGQTGAPSSDFVQPANIYKVHDSLTQSFDNIFVIVIFSAKLWCSNFGFLSMCWSAVTVCLYVFLHCCKCMYSIGNL